MPASPWCPFTHIFLVGLDHPNNNW